MPAVAKAAVRKPSTTRKTVSCLREGHLEVDLGELRLAVGAEVFVAEAAGDLEVAVEAGDHEDLLEDLRRLRQRVERAGVDAAGDEVVACAFGGGARHERRFDLEEAVLDKIVRGSPCATWLRRAKLCCISGRRRSR